MWLLQHKNIHKRHLLWLKLFSICLFFHSLFLVWLFLLYKDTAYTYLLSVDKKTDYSIAIIFKPVIEHDNKKNTPIRESKKIEDASQKIKNSLSVAKIKQETLVKEEPKLPAKKAIEVVPKIDEIKETEHPAQRIEEKKPKLNLNATKEIINQEPVKKEMGNKPNLENAFVHNNYKEVEILRCGAQLQKEIVKQWHPPIGVSSDCLCKVSFVVSNKGNIEEMKIIKPSGTMMFDISVKQAIHTMKMPHWTYGKSLVITFKQ